MIRFLLVFVFLMPVYLTAQLDDEESSNGYFIKMNNTLNLRLDLDNDVRSFVYETEDYEYSVEPNTNLRMAVNINYRFISLKVGFSPKFLAGEDSDLKGTTKIFRLSLNIFIKDWLQNFDYNQVKGYYVQGSPDPVSGILPSDSEFIILPDLKTLSITGTTSYRFNENYSFKAVINQNEIQIKSAGSFIPSLYYGYFEMTNQTTSLDIHSYFIIANAGYFHTFVLNRNWYSNLGLSTGLGIEFNKEVTRIQEQDDEIDRQNNLVFDINSQIGIGYNSGRFYSGMALFGSAITRDKKSIIKFDSVRGYFKIYVGYRFGAPKSFERGMDWIESKNPFKKK